MGEAREKALRQNKLDVLQGQKKRQSGLRVHDPSRGEWGKMRPGKWVGT